MTARRFPSPWSAELQPNYYVVRDADGQQIAYVYYSNDPERRTAALPLKEAPRIIAVCPKDHLCYTSSPPFWWSSGYSVYSRLHGR